MPLWQHKNAQSQILVNPLDYIIRYKGWKLVSFLRVLLFFPSGIRKTKGRQKKSYNA